MFESEPGHELVLTEFIFVIFLVPLQKNAGIVPKVGDGHFLPQSLNFALHPLIRTPSPHRMLYVLFRGSFRILYAVLRSLVHAECLFEVSFLGLVTQFSSPCSMPICRSPVFQCAHEMLCVSLYRHGQSAGHHSRQGCERRAPVLHQPPATYASRRAAKRTAKHPCVHPAGARPRHGPQHPLFHRERSQ